MGSTTRKKGIKRVPATHLAQNTASCSGGLYSRQQQVILHRQRHAFSLDTASCTARLRL